MKLYIKEIYIVELYIVEPNICFIVYKPRKIAVCGVFRERFSGSSEMRCFLNDSKTIN